MTLDDDPQSASGNPLPDTPLTTKAGDAGPYAQVAERIAQQHDYYQHCVPLTLKAAEDLTTNLLGIMFPHFATSSCRYDLADALSSVENQIIPLLDCALKSGPEVPKTIARAFLTALPDLADIAMQDAKALLAGDPAAKSLDEVMLAYPGFYAATVYRLAHFLWQENVPIIPRMMTEAAHQRTGIDIHPGARIGRAFYIDHGTGVVIGETTIIGDNVKLYQGVTLGGYRVDKDENVKRHPTLEDNVTVYAGATILGGETRVGHDSVIGGNVWLTRSVPPWSRVMFRPCDSEEIIPAQAREKE